MRMPPTSEQRVPRKETPPLTPGLHFFKVVMRIGADLERIPSSDASVSPRQHAKRLDR